MPKKNSVVVRVNAREHATILAALRYHQDENLQADIDVRDQAIRDIATDAGAFKPLGFDEVGELCERLNLDGHRPVGCLVIDPPPGDAGDEQLFRVAYTIDVSASNAQNAARQAHSIMTDPESLPPVLDVLDHCGNIASIDLAGEQMPKRTSAEPCTTMYEVVCKDLYHEHWLAYSPVDAARRAFAHALECGRKLRWVIVSSMVPPEDAGKGGLVYVSNDAWRFPGVNGRLCLETRPRRKRRPTQ